MNPLLIDSFVLGIQHSFEPDHLAAVSVLASEKRRRYHLWRVIWRSSHWALGHSFALILFACLIILLKSALSLNIAEWVELAVGPLMIWLGVVAIRRNSPKRSFAARPAVYSAHPTALSRSFWVGMVHGLAGTGGACTVALTLAARDAPTAIWIIILQSGGIILAMTLYGCLLAFSVDRVHNQWRAALRIINYAVGIFSIGIGLYTLAEVARA